MSEQQSSSASVLPSSIQLSSLFKKKKLKPRQQSSSSSTASPSALIRNINSKESFSSNFNKDLSNDLSTIATTNDEDEELDSGNVVISRSSNKRFSSSQSKKNSNSNSVNNHRTGATKITKKKSSLSFGVLNDDSLDSTDNSPRRKLQRPKGLETPDSKLISSEPLSRPISESSRPTYSSSHLNELRSSNLSSLVIKKSDQSLDSLTTSKFSEQPEDGSEAVVANIPSSSIIKSAKERRSQARKAGLTNLSSGVNLSKDLTSPSGQDFISLSTASDLTRAITSKSGESRLVREEDEFGEGDDEHAEYTGAKERVPLGEKAGLRAEASRKAGMESMITEAGEDLYEGNEEELEWEAEQIRRGGIGNSVGEKTTTQPSKQIYRAAPVPERRNLNTLSSVTSRFSDSLGLLEDSVSEQEQNVIIFETAEKSLDQQESDLRLEVSREIEREVFFQDFKAFIDDINQFFSVKWLELEKVEKDLLSILRERSQLICKRRYEDLSDDLALFKSGDVGITRPSVVEEDLKQNGNEDEVRGKDESADEFDELGRSRRELDISSQAPSRRYRRKERIERRKRRRAGEGRVASAPEDEGYSTDDSLSPADSSDLLSASQSLISSTSDILRDTSNPIFLSPTNPSSIAEKFQAWKSNYPEDYSNAYGNLALVQAWEFWVRMEIVGGLNLWSIREWVEVKDRRGIENWRWMKGLEAYDHSCSIEDQEDRSDSVVPEMIKEVVIPVLTTLIRCSYDPLSVVATTKALELVEQIGCFIDLEEEDCDEKCERFVMSFLERFKISLQELKHLISDGDDDFKRSLLSQVGCEGIEARNRFLNRCLKLFKQGLRWRRFFNRKLTMMSYDDESKSFVEQEEEGRRVLSFKEVLSGELVEGIMVPVILIGWETGGKEISKKILECSPNGVLNERLIETLKEGYVKEEVQ